MTRTTVTADAIYCVDALESKATWIGFEDGRITHVGFDDPPDASLVLEGFILPGLIDAHVHLTTTGLYASGLDFRDCRSVTELLGVLAEYCAKSTADWVIGGNFDPGRNAEGRMPTRVELDSVARERFLLVSRADGHSCALNSKGLDAAALDPGTSGIERDFDGKESGVLSHEANYEARRRFFGSLPVDVIGDAQMSGCRIALSRGVTSLHEMAGGSFMGDKDFEVLRDRLGRYPIHVRTYLATNDVGRVASYGLDCIGGDWFLDGSIGSRTAAMRSPYQDDKGKGFLYHSDEEVVEFFVDSSRAGLQAGVHAIGDAAIEQALTAIEEAFVRLGPEGAAGARRLRHRIEHFECVDDSQLERAARLGVVASVQPMFDGYWGGKGRMYESRLGERAHRMNPFLSMLQKGLVLAGGSDSTVTPLDPFLGINAAVNHNNPDLGVAIGHAIRMFTIWAAVAGRDEMVRGSLEVGKVADFCVVDRDPFESVDLDETQVLQTWVGGEKAFEK